MKLVQYNLYSFSNLGTDGLVLKHQGISSYSVRSHIYRLMQYWGYMKLSLTQ